MFLPKNGGTFEEAPTASSSSVTTKRDHPKRLTNEHTIKNIVDPAKEAIEAVDKIGAEEYEALGDDAKKNLAALRESINKLISALPKGKKLTKPTGLKKRKVLHI